MNVKLIIAQMSVMTLLSRILLAQATFELRNYDPPYGIDIPIFDAQGIPIASTNYLGELWGGATPDDLAPLTVIDEGNRREIIPFNNRGHLISTSGFLAVTSVLPFRWAWLQMRAWDARLGASYEAVSARGIGGYGESPLFYAKGKGPS